MIEFITLSIRNFLSYGNATTVFDLHNPGTTLIVGENMDDTTHGEGSNGVGKSVLINALTYALYDKTVSSISKDNMINNQNKANLEVTVTFRKDNKFYHVRRCRKMTKTKPSGSFVQLFERTTDTNFTSEDEKTLGGVGNTNTCIEDILGIPHELFVRIIVFSAMHTPFLDLSTPKQVEIVEGLFGLQQLRQKADVLKEQIKTTEQDIKFEEQNIQFQEKNQSQHIEDIRVTKQHILDWNNQQELRVQETETALAQISGIDFSKEDEVHKHIEKALQEANTVLQQERNVQINIEKARKQKREAETLITQNQETLELLADVDLAKEQKLHNDRQTYENQAKDFSHTLTTTQNTVHRLETTRQEIDDEIKHLQDAKCPYCHQNMPDAKLKLKETQQRSASIIIDLESSTKEQAVITKQLTFIQNKLAKINEQITVDNIDQLIKLHNQQDTILERVKTKKQEIQKINSELVLLDTELDKLRKDSNKLLQQVEQYRRNVQTKSRDDLYKHQKDSELLQQKLKTLREAENPYYKTLNDLESRKPIKIQYNKINELQKLLVHQKFLVKVLTRKDSFVRRALLDKHLQYLNKRLQVYLNELGLPHRVEFTPSLTANITEFDHTLDFGNLSNGQRSRVNLALSLAFRDYLQSVHSQVNVCLFDEVLDVGLDTIGVQLAAKLIQHKAREEKSSLYIISHRDEITHSFDHRMVVTLQKGFSYVRNEF